MKRLFLTLLILFFTTSSALATNNFGHRGPLNFIQTKILEKTISSQLERQYGGLADIKIKSYGAKALRNGIFQSAQLNLNDIKIEDISISNLNLETTSIENKLDITDIKNIKLISNIDAIFSASISNEDLKNILNTPIYQNEISKINTKLSPLASIKIREIFCQENRLFITLNINTLGIKMNTTCSSEIFIENGDIMLKDIKLSKNSGTLISTTLTNKLERINPIKTSIKALGNSNFDIEPTNVKIVNDKIEISGIIRIYNKD